MDVIVRITSNYTTTQLVGQTQIGSAWMVCTEDFEIMTQTTFESQYQPKGARIFTFNFEGTQRYCDIKYNDTPLPIPKDLDPMQQEQIRAENDLNKRKKNAVENFFAYHNQIAHKSKFKNNNFVPQNPAFKIEILTQKSLDNIRLDQKRVEAFTKFMALSFQEQYDVTLYYAPFLYGKRRSEICYGMVGLSGIGDPSKRPTGVLMDEAILDDFLYHYQPDSAVSMKIYLNKAIESGVLTRGEAGLLYINGQTPVGKDVMDAITYFQKDQHMYTGFIQPEVNKRSDLPEDDMIETEPNHLALKIQLAEGKKERTEMATPLYQEDFKRLKALGASLGIKVDDYGYNDLKAKIEAVEAQKVFTAGTESLPTPALKIAIDPTVTNDIEDLKRQCKELGIQGWHNIQNPDTARKKIKEALEEKAAKELRAAKYKTEQA